MDRAERVFAFAAQGGTQRPAAHVECAPGVRAAEPFRGKASSGALYELGGAVLLGFFYDRWVWVGFAG